MVSFNSVHYVLSTCVCVRVRVCAAISYVCTCVSLCVCVCVCVINLLAKLQTVVAARRRGLLFPRIRRDHGEQERARTVGVFRGP